MGVSKPLKITYRPHDHGDLTIDLPVPPEGQKYILAERVECGKCGRRPMRIICGEAHIHSYDEYEARAACGHCGGGCGKVIVRVRTLFGLEEDRAVLEGRPRVY